MKTSKFNVNKMTCSACISHVEKTVLKLNGITKVNVQLLSNSMDVEFDEKLINDDDISNAVTKAGYPTNLKNHKVKVKQKIEDKTKEMKIRLFISIGFLIPLMYLSMGPMMGLPIFDIFTGDKNAVINTFTQFLLCLPIVFVNRHYFISGFKKLFIRKPNMDSLIALGSGASFLYGVIAIYMITYGQNYDDIHIVHQYMHDIYFESAATILTLITLGKFLEEKSKGKTTEAIKKLIDLAPKTAIRLINDIEEEVLVEDINIDDILVIKPGTKSPVDGIVVKGHSSMDESALTGESIPVEKQIGDKILSASTNNTGILLIKATKVGENSTISQIIKLVEEAGNSKAPISKLADKVSGVFVPVVISISLLAFFYWFLIGKESISFSLSISIAVLVISCPCALGLATPVAIMVGTQVGATNGILIKSGEALEIAHHIDTIVLDKTGTITHGKPQVTDVFSTNYYNDEYLLKRAYHIERFSEHPLASAVNEYVKKYNFDTAEVSDYNAIVGKGIIGIIENKKVIAGNMKLLDDYNLNNDWVKNKFETLAQEGKTPLFFCEEDKVIGVIAVADTIKETSKKAISLMREMNLDVIMLTGDNSRTAQAIAKEVNTSNVISDVMPQDKELVIRNLQNEGKKVAMVGDGINDAPALARADVGIAICAGMDIAIDSADMVLMKSDLLDAISAIKLSKSVIKNIKGNLFWAFFYNSIGIPVAAGVFYGFFGFKLNPMIAAAAMSLSSVCVVCNALRLKSFKTYKTNIKKKEDNFMNKNILIEGMMCSHCTNHVQTALNKLEGVTVVTIDTKHAEVKLDKEISNDVLSNTITEAGYKVVDIKSDDKNTTCSNNGCCCNK
ncbi:MAG: heavy metal translocating P-type ATPase [bacterium]